MTAAVWAGVAVLGGCGAVLRFLVDGAVSARLGRSFPVGILVVNLSGAFALGVLTGLAFEGTRALLVGTALLGSYTTFSTWMVDSRRLAGRRPRLAAANLLVGLGAGVVAAALGRWLGTAF